VIPERFGDVVQSLATRDPGLTIYTATTRPLSEDSPAVVVMEGEPIPANLAYLLEVSLAAEVLEVWSDWRAGRAPSPSEAVAAVEWYADHDAYLPVDE